MRSSFIYFIRIFKNYGESLLRVPPRTNDLSHYHFECWDNFLEFCSKLMEKSSKVVSHIGEQDCGIVNLWGRSDDSGVSGMLPGLLLVFVPLFFSHFII
jgi:hypothetical protein